MNAHGARTRCKVREEARRLYVSGIVMCWWAGLEYEDAQVRVRCCKTASKDTSSSATYQGYSQLEKRGIGGRAGALGTSCDDDIVFFVDCGGSRHATLRLGDLIGWKSNLKGEWIKKVSSSPCVPR